MNTWDDSVLLTLISYFSWLCSSICFWLFQYVHWHRPRSRPKPLLPLFFLSNQRLLVKAELNWRWRKERSQYAIAYRQFNIIVLFSTILPSIPQPVIFLKDHVAHAAASWLSLDPPLSTFLHFWYLLTSLPSSSLLYFQFISFSTCRSVASSLVGIVVQPAEILTDI